MSSDLQQGAPRPRVAVYGAGGHTGRFVVRELVRRGFGVTAIGRDPARLAAAAFPPEILQVEAAIEDDRALDRALAGAAAVISCAGPFLDTAHALVAAALRQGLHYLDVTAEQLSAQATFDAYGEAAVKAGVVVIPAMGFYGGLSDLLTTAAMGDWLDADDARIGIALDSWWPTAGTRITGRRNTARRLNITDGTLGPLPDPAPTMVWSFDAPFGAQPMVELSFSETVLIARHLRFAELHTWLNTTPLDDLRDEATPPPVAADASGRSAQRFGVEVEVRRGEAVRRAAFGGRDIYAVTAPLVVEALERLFGSGDLCGGVFAPGELFDARDFLAAVERATAEDRAL
jgi:saccharopine dehydrogenase-like protein